MTPDPGDTEAEIAEVAGEIEDLAASQRGPLAIALKLCARRLRVVLLLKERCRLRAL